MENQNINSPRDTKLSLIFKTDSGDYTEHESAHETMDEALDEANEVAFATVGFNLESWKPIGNFEDLGQLYVYYPNDDDRTTRYLIKIIAPLI